MDFEHACKSAERFHKSTVLLASMVMGLSVNEIINKNIPLPLIMQKDGILYLVSLATDLKDNDFITPYVVNGAFSLELHLKIIGFLETKRWNSGHHLDHLFELLSKETQKIVSSSVSKALENSKETQAYLNILKEKNVTINWDVHSLLKESYEAFSKWRYAFESQVGCFAGYTEIQKALSDRIIALNN